MWVFDLPEHVNVIVFSDSPHCADEVAETVNGQNSSAVEWGNQEAARHVCPVVFHLVDLGPELRRYIQRTCQLLAQVMYLGGIREPGGDQPGKVREARDRKQNFLVQVRGGIPRNANMVELINRDVGSLQAIADCGSREPSTVLLAVEPFFLYGRDTLTILYDRGRGVAVVSVNSQDVQREAPASLMVTRLI